MKYFNFFAFLILTIGNTYGQVGCFSTKEYDNFLYNKFIFPDKEQIESFAIKRIKLFKQNKTEIPLQIFDFNRQGEHLQTLSLRNDSVNYIVTEKNYLDSLFTDLIQIKDVCGFDRKLLTSVI